MQFWTSFQYPYAEPIHNLLRGGWGEEKWLQLGYFKGTRKYRGLPQKEEFGEGTMSQGLSTGLDFRALRPSGYEIWGKPTHQIRIKGLLVDIRNWLSHFGAQYVVLFVITWTSNYHPLKANLVLDDYNTDMNPTVVSRSNLGKTLPRQQNITLTGNTFVLKDKNIKEKNLKGFHKKSS